MLDLTKCRLAFVTCEVAGEFSSMEEFANKLNLSRSTVSRFFSGRSPSLATTRAILEALHLRFEDVATPEVRDEPDTSDT